MLTAHEVVAGRRRISNTRIVLSAAAPSARNPRDRIIRTERLPSGAYGHEALRCSNTRTIRSRIIA